LGVERHERDQIVLEETSKLNGNTAISRG
jgi:hypothetical protein